MIPTAALPLISRLDQMIHDRHKGFIEPNAPLALLDFPDIRNCGDSAIWLGEIAWLKKRFNKEPAFVSRNWDLRPDDLRAAVPDGPIFIHGGGNFGDIWPGRQEFREGILEEFSDYKIIQFPQSIRYGNVESIVRTARVIGKHKNFTLMVRDAESKDLAEKYFDCEVQLSPDMAFAIGPMGPRKTRSPLLAMLREDIEKKGDIGTWAYPSVPKEDWITEQKYKITLAKMRGSLPALLAGADIRKFHRLNAVATQRLERGIRQISRARVIVTDRLHVHICSVLLGRPHAVLDNSYGKIQRLMDAFYPEGCALTYRATSLKDAMDWAFAKEEALGKGKAA